MIDEEYPRLLADGRTTPSGTRVRAYRESLRQRDVLLLIDEQVMTVTHFDTLDDGRLRRHWTDDGIFVTDCSGGPAKWKGQCIVPESALPSEPERPATVTADPSDLYRADLGLLA